MIKNNFSFDIWQDALENEKKRQRELVQPLIDKYGWPLNENNMALQDALAFDYVKPYVQKMEQEMFAKENEQEISAKENNYPYSDKDNSDFGKTKRKDETFKLAENTTQTSKSDCKPDLAAPEQGESEEMRLLRKMGEQLKEEGFGEGVRQHIYLDTNGKITTGNGANIDNEKTFMSLNWTYDNKRPATREEIKEAYQIFLEAKAKREFGQKYTANYYEDKSKLRVTKDYADELMYKHLKNDLAQLKKDFPRFNEAPEALKIVLLDICYNTGNVSKKEWPNLHKAFKEKNLTKILDNVNRKSVSAARNKWAKEKIRSIAEKDGWHW